MRKPKILVVGSFVMDQIASTEVFPGEGETVLGKTFHKAPGGKGANQAVQAARLGADVTMVGKLGRDTNGEELLKACREAGIHTEHVIYDEKLASGCAVIILEEKEGESAKNRILVIPGTNMSMEKAELEFMEDLIKEYDLLMLQLEIPMEVNEYLAELAWKNGIPVMLNPAPSAPLSDRLLSCVTYLSPKEHEARDLTGIQIHHTESGVRTEDIEKAVRILKGKKVPKILITLGDAGAVLAEEDEMIREPSVPGITAADPTAAGDSFVAAFCVGVCCGWEKKEQLQFANSVAALTVSKMGAMPSLPGLQQVETFMRERNQELPDFGRLR